MARTILISLIVISIIVGTSALVLINYYWCPDLSLLASYHTRRYSRIHAVRTRHYNSEYISINQISPHIINAFLAAEDHTFFDHHGISYRALARASLTNLYHGRALQGASTITHQLVKLLFLNGDKTLTRKIKEQWYVWAVERQFSKHQILETYLNIVYFGCGIYGVQKASQRFWHISAADVTVEQAATLAGIVKSPCNYCPLVHPTACRMRRDQVLRKMLRLQYISEQEYCAIVSHT